MSERKTIWKEIPLKPGSPCIRILTLHRGARDDPIVCSLGVSSLDDNPAYWALSYAWGDWSDTRPVTVNGASLDITVNLSDFLTCLRSPDHDLLVWADAICIDQSDPEEKPHQIGLMARIYRQAEEAHIWLGYFTENWLDEISSNGYITVVNMTEDHWRKAEEHFSADIASYLKLGGKVVDEKDLLGPSQLSGDSLLTQAIHSCAMIVESENLHRTPLLRISRDDYGRDVAKLNTQIFIIFDCIYWILSRAWWSRVWTLQESVLPIADPVIHVGLYKLQMSTVTRAVFVIRECMKYALSRTVMKLLYSVRSYNSYKLFLIPIHRVWLLYRSFHRTPGSDSKLPFIELSDALRHAMSRRATDVRDYYFGISSLTSPSYNKYLLNRPELHDPISLFSWCSKIYLKQQRNLVDLQRASGMGNSTLKGLPSWAIDFSMPYDVIERGSWVQFAADAGIKQDKTAIATLKDFEGSTLEVRGLFVGQIQKSASSVTTIGIEESNKSQLAIVKSHMLEWQRLFAEHAKRSDDDSFWRTVIRDNNIKDTNVMQNEPLEPGILKTLKDDWSNCAAADTLNQLGRETYPKNFWLLLQSVKFYRFFITGEGKPGLGPHELLPSDEIHVLAGCPAPAVLRRLKEGEQASGTNSFSFVGLCFLDGWMYGAATQKGADWQPILLH